MAKLKNNLFSGVLGPYILKIVNGKQIVVARPRRGSVKQTKQTKQASKCFAYASSLGARIRTTLNAHYSGTFDLDCMNRLTGRLVKIQRKLNSHILDSGKLEGSMYSGLEDFEFNSNMLVSNLLLRNLDVKVSEKILSVTLPQVVIAEAFKFPARSVRCTLSVNLSLFRLNEGLYVHLAENQQVSFLKNGQVAGPYAFNFDLPAGCLCLVSVFLAYDTANNAGWQKIIFNGYNPGRICAAVDTPGVHLGDDGRVWRTMRLKSSAMVPNRL